jgi:hypothetical protein
MAMKIADMIYKNSTVLNKRQAKQLARLRRIMPTVPRYFEKLNLKNYEKELIRNDIDKRA